MSWRPATVALGVVLIFAACGSDGGSEAADGKAARRDEAEVAGGTPVSIANFVFEPQEIQVPPGTKVTWTNKDSAPHDVQDLSALKIPISPELLEGYSFSITYRNPGSYPYNCSLHPFMTGTVKVA